MVFTKATRRFLNKTNQPPQQFQPQQRFIQQPQRYWNQFQSGAEPTPLESSMDLLFGQEGQDLVDNTQFSSPQLETSNVGDIVSSVMDELGMNQQPQPQRFIQRRRRRR